MVDFSAPDESVRELSELQDLLLHRRRVEGGLPSGEKDRFALVLIALGAPNHHSKVSFSLTGLKALFVQRLISLSELCRCELKLNFGS